MVAFVRGHAISGARPIFEFCTDPSVLDSGKWVACYLTTPKHAQLYWSILTVFLLLACTVPVTLGLGFVGAVGARSRNVIARGLGKGYIAVVRGVPDIAYFLFFIIALDQFIEIIRHEIKCPGWTQSIWQGDDFVVCPEAKMPLSSAEAWVHDAYSFALAVITFSLVFGAFAANTLYGAMRAVPKSQIEAASAYGMSDKQTFRRIIVPQMWVYALPGLSNLWMIMIKATPLLFLLGIEDIVYWARELGGTANPRFTAYPHGDWRIYYFGFLLIFYIALTIVSERFFERLMRRFTHGQAVAGRDGRVGGFL